MGVGGEMEVIIITRYILSIVKEFVCINAGC